MDSPLRVLHIVSSLDARMGGPVIALAGLAGAQKRQGYDIRVCATFVEGEDSAAADGLKTTGIPLHLIGPCHTPLRRHSALKPTLQQAIDSVDVVHIHALWEEILHQGAVLARKRKIPYIFRPCGMLDPWSLQQGRLKKKIYMALRLRYDLNHAALLHFTAELERDLTAPLRLRAPTIIEPNGIALKEFQELPGEGEFRATQPRLRDRPIVLFLSRIHPKKGLDLLLPAFARVASEQDAVLVVAGPDSGGYRAEVEQLVRQLNVSDRVLFTGMIRGRDRLCLLRDASFFVLPSYQENFGIAVVEAMAAGKGVIISDQVNIHREISASGSGLVVRTNVDELASAIRQWLAHPEQAASAGKAGRTFAVANYDWDVIARHWDDHYRKLVAN